MYSIGFDMSDLLMADKTCDSYSCVWIFYDRSWASSISQLFWGDMWFSCWAKHPHSIKCMILDKLKHRKTRYLWTDSKVLKIEGVLHQCDSSWSVENECKSYARSWTGNGRLPRGHCFAARHEQIRHENTALVPVCACGIWKASDVQCSLYTAP